MRYLRQNTATRVTVGPFMDATDAKTPEVALTATNEKLTFIVDDSGVPTLVIDANATASGGNNDFVHITGDDAGYYDLELTAAQTNYVGRAMLSINYGTDHLPVFHEFEILAANAYDAMHGADRLEVDVKELGSSTSLLSAFGKNVGEIYEFTVTNTGFSPTATEFETDSITEATSNHFVDCLVVWTSGSLKGKRMRVNAYSLSGGRGHFTITDKGEAPGNGDTGILV